MVGFTTSPRFFWPFCRMICHSQITPCQYATHPRHDSRQREIVSRIAQVLSLITCKHNVQQKSYWTRRQKRVKLDDYRRSRTDLTSRGRQWSVPNRLPDFDNDMSASSRIEDSHPGQSPREDP